VTVDHSPAASKDWPDVRRTVRCVVHGTSAHADRDRWPSSDAPVVSPLGKATINIPSRCKNHTFSRCLTSRKNRSQLLDQVLQNPELMRAHFSESAPLDFCPPRFQWQLPAAANPSVINSGKVLYTHVTTQARHLDDVQHHSNQQRAHAS
jgi:hypothetical protein